MSVEAVVVLRNWGAKTIRTSRITPNVELLSHGGGEEGRRDPSTTGLDDPPNTSRLELISFAQVGHLSMRNSPTVCRFPKTILFFFLPAMVFLLRTVSQYLKGTVCHNDKIRSPAKQLLHGT